jgi:L-fuculose-phosphate aldolase
MGSDNNKIREQIVAMCKYMSGLRFFVGTWGNISVRLKDSFLITPSALDYNTMTAEDIVEVDFNGDVISGKRVPSSETLLHMEVLKYRTDFNAVIHAHSTYLSILACAHKDLPVIVEDMAQIIGANIRCSEYVPGGHHKELAAITCKYIGQKSQAVMLANHGVVVGGVNLANAATALEVAEKAAEIFIKSSAVGGSKNMPDWAIEEERNRYLFKYGREDVTKH